VTITWEGGALQSSPALASEAVWTEINGPGGTYTEIVGSANKFFRVKQ
jgi:hypothetical protein